MFEITNRVEVWHIDIDKVYCRYVEKEIAEQFFNSPYGGAFRTREDALIGLGNRPTIFND